jgi:hypothetical protein
VEAIRAWMANRAKPGEGALDLAAERAALARVQREYTELKIARERGLLIPREAVAMLDAARQSSARAAMLRLPVDALQRGVPREYEPILRDLAEGVLTALASAKWEEVEPA